jgi:hypothetical protein
VVIYWKNSSKEKLLEKRRSTQHTKNTAVPNTSCHKLITLLSLEYEPVQIIFFQSNVETNAKRTNKRNGSRTQVLVQGYRADDDGHNNQTRTNH